MAKEERQVPEDSLEKDAAGAESIKEDNPLAEEAVEDGGRESGLEEQRRVNLASRWMEGSGPESDIVISSRVRLARNVGGITFPSLASDEQRKKVYTMMNEVVGSQQDKFSSFELIDMESLSSIERQVYVEKHLISPLLARGGRFSALLLREDEVVSIMINEEDHFRIQCLLPGLNLDKSWQESTKFDDCLEKQVDYAFHEQLGYLAACPTNVGTGLRASVMVHLPALVITRQINRILSAVNQVGLAIRGLYGEGTEAAGNLFQVSNQVTLGQSEDEILQNLYSITGQLVKQEKNARELLLNEGREKVADRAGRAFGILMNARIIASDEAMRLLSDVRLGVDMGLLKNVTARSLNELLVLTRPGCLQYLKGKPLSPYERDLERAVQIQKCLS